VGDEERSEIAGREAERFKLRDEPVESHCAAAFDKDCAAVAVHDERGRRARDTEVARVESRDADGRAGAIGHVSKVAGAVPQCRQKLLLYFLLERQ
jgi:hypothetical protein